MTTGGMGPQATMLLKQVATQDQPEQKPHHGKSKTLFAV